MSRIDYSEEEDFPGQFNLWQANCRRSIRGRAGQAAIRELIEALEALPAKRLQRHVVACDGDVCAVGAVLLMRRAREVGSIEAAQAALEVELGPADDQEFHETAELGESLGMPRLVAWKLVSLNDIEFDGRYVQAEGPPPSWDRHRTSVTIWQDITPEERYEKMLAWAKAQLSEGAATKEG